MTTLEAWQKEWIDPDPRYNDERNCGVCPNERRFDRKDENRHWLNDDEEFDKELDFND